MITRITLTNFMSHAQTVIEPAAGLTVLVGANNVGKSAVVAALQILCRNENSTYVKRHGSRECSVRVETDDGHVIEWRRKNSPSYLINDQLFDRLREGGLPDELHRALRLPCVDAGGDREFDVHFGAQKSPIFLLDRSGTVAAKFFASSSDAIRLVQIQKRHKDKHAAAKADKKRLEEESRRINAQLDVLAPMVAIDDRLQAIEQQHADLLQAQQDLEEAQKLATELATQTEHLSQRQAVVDVLADLPPPPELFPVAVLAELIEQIAQAERNVAKARARDAALSPLQSPPVWHDVAGLSRLIGDLTEQTRTVACGVATGRALSSLSVPPKLVPTEPLQILVQELNQAAQRQGRTAAMTGVFQQLAEPPALGDETALCDQLAALTVAVHQASLWQARCNWLRDVSPPPVPEATLELAACVSQWDAALEQRQQCEDALATVTAEWAHTQAALRESAAGSHCRVCGAALDPDRVLAQAIAGLEGHAHE